MSDFSSEFEFNQSGDIFADYCLWAYEPLADVQGKHKSINLLLNSFAAAGVHKSALAFVRAIQDVMGKGNTVWGVKQVDGILSWEFYFYDYERLARRNSVTRLLSGLSDRFKTTLKVNEQSPYFMFSIDLTVADLNQGWAQLDEVNIYMGNDGSDVSSGICYSLTDSGLSLDNLYYFYDSQLHRDSIIAKLACSAHLALPKLQLEQVLLPELATCQTTVVANKKNNDGIYFSRMSVAQLEWFLRYANYPSHILDYVSQHQSQLDHMLYDVGIDYTMNASGDIVTLKTSYYGVF